MIKKILFVIFLFFSMVPFQLAVKAKTSSLKAAFIRNDDLWIKTGDIEGKITSGLYVRYPKWSNDGNWIVYLRGEKVNGDIVHFGDLWLYNLKLNKHFKIQSNVRNNFQWSPQQNKLSFLVNTGLYVVDVGGDGRVDGDGKGGGSRASADDNGDDCRAIADDSGGCCRATANNSGDLNRSFLAVKIAENVKNFSWLPNENGLLISVKESPRPNSNIFLSKIFFGTTEETKTIKPFFTVFVSKEENYASTSQFKWSFDNRWISFLLVPTPSVSADSNTLCLLSSDGKVFKKIDEMLNYEDWFKWAPSKSLLGYISGIGREALFQKRLMIVNVPAFQNVQITPNSFADRDLTWLDNNTIVVARAPETKWVNIEKRPLPSLFEIKLTSNRQKQLTFPLKNQADFAPQMAEKQLIWVRTDRQAANIFVSPVEKMKEKLWIQNITVSSAYYEKWNWDEVFSLYKGK